MTKHTTTDYLAVIPIGTGSSWGRSPDKEKAIKIAVASFRDWGNLFKVSGVPVLINVLDVHGYDEVSWGYGGVRGKNEATGKDEPITRTIEHVERTTPKWKVRR